MRRLALGMVGVCVAALAIIGCGKDDNTAPTSSTGRLHLRMTDAPADYDSVVIVINEVAVHRTGADSTAWSTFTPANTVIDLMRLTNGLFVELGNFTLPSGSYNQIRLLIAPGSHVVVDGVSYPLEIPSGVQSGVKIHGDFVVPAGGVAEFGLDFDAARSIHTTGGGVWIMNPVIRMASFATTGSITGTLVPGDSLSTIYALSGADTIASTFNQTSGDFALSLLPAGTYNVKVDAPVSRRDTLITGVSVTAGQTTSLGTIPLSPQ